MERIVIIDHEAHEAYIEDISDEDLERYGGDEQAYIDDTYTFEGDYSWDYVTDIQYFDEEDKTPMEVEPKDWI